MSQVDLSESTHVVNLIRRESPLLAKAIAAEHLLQVFLTHGDQIGKKEELASKNAIQQVRIKETIG